ncbi:MAG: hypothetical protein ACLFP2_03860 [Candidatus Woesearchaeota archaeon]
MNENELEELREEAKNISGTCCRRHSARRFFWNKAEGMNNEELIQLYQIVDGPMHSYCNETKSSTTRSNLDIIKKVLEASLEMLVESEDREEALNSHKMLISDYRHNNHGDYSEINPTKKIDLVQQLKSEEDYVTALDLLNTVDYEPQEELFKRYFDNLKGDLYENLLCNAIRVIANDREVDFDDKRLRIADLIRETPSEYTSSAVKEKGKTLIKPSDKGTESELKTCATRYVRRKREDLEERYQQVKEGLLEEQQVYRSQKELLDEEKKMLEESLAGRGKLKLISILHKFMPDQYEDLTHKINVYDRKLDSLEKHYKRSLESLSDQKRSLHDKIENRTLTRDEYKKIF